MYCPDTLTRLNDEAVEAHRSEIEDNQSVDCDFCNERAVETLEIFNPADAMREPPVTGAYSTVDRCEECSDNGYGMEDVFRCAGCDVLFIRNHSWDVLSVTLDSGEYCQKCAAEEIMPIPLCELYNALEHGDVSVFTRINNIPGKEEIWSGEFSQYNDFPGHTSLGSVLRSIKSAFLGESVGTLVYPIIDHGYQFSVSLAVYK